MDKSTTDCRSQFPPGADFRATRGTALQVPQHLMIRFHQELLAQERIGKIAKLTALHLEPSLICASPRRCAGAHLVSSATIRPAAVRDRGAGATLPCPQALPMPRQFLCRPFLRRRRE